MLRRTLAIALLGALTLGPGACAAVPPDATAGSAPGSAPADGPGHGEVEGAREMKEPQLGLTSIDATGRVDHLDLLDESVDGLGSVTAPAAVASDGRYAFAMDEDGVTIVDSGRWTWDHVDHFHYYLAEPRLVGRVDGEGIATVATTMSSTTGGTGLFFPDSGEAVLLDTGALPDGEIVERFRLSTAPHAGVIAPLGSFALVTQPEQGVAASVIVVDGHGDPVAGAGAECADARGTITTRVGVVIGCADGALLATLDSGEVLLERIPYPADASAPRAVAFAGRDGRPTVAAAAGGEGIWLLDTRERSWMLLPTDEAVTGPTAVDDGAGHVLALSLDGRVLVVDGATGATLSRTEPLLAESVSSGAGEPAFVVDQHRAYLNAPAERLVHEIDFADGGRIARTFPMPSEPAFIAGTGR